MNNNTIIGSIFLDIAKAFNCINHRVLFLKMAKAGFSENVIKWFRSYLTRFQHVRIGEQNSPKKLAADGIAHGTFLGPLIFIFYIDYVISCLKHVNISMFADDCVLYVAGNNWNSVKNKLQSDLNAFVNWCDQNALSLNTSKTNTMIFGNRQKILKNKNPVPLVIHGKNITFVKKYTYLGVILDAELNLDPFYKSILKKVNNKIYTLRKIRKYITFDVASQIYKQTILPLFEYGGFLIKALNKDKRNELQIIQNDILRICNMSKLSDRISLELLHKKAKLLSLEQRRQKQLLILMYIYSKAENVQYIPKRSTDKFVFKTETNIGTKYEKSGFYQGTKLWNNLSREIQESED